MSQNPGLAQFPRMEASASSRPSFISEEEMRSERERWRQTCMHEVWNLENAAFERINSQLEEATSKLSEDVTREVMRHIEEERSQRIAAVNEVRAALMERADNEALASLRRDVQAAQATASEVARSQLRQQPGSREAGEATETQAAVRALRSELDMRTAQQQASSSGLEARLQEYKLQVSSMEAAIADLRSDLAQQRERQDLQNMAAITELRQEFGGVQLAQQQVLADQAAKGSIEAKRSLQELSLETQRELRELRATVTTRQEEIEVLQHQHRDLCSTVRLEGASQTEVASLGHRLELAEKQLALVPTSSSESLFKDQLLSAQNELQRLSLEMAEERNDRCKSLSEVNRLMESLSRATSASLDQTEQRLTSKISAVSSNAQTPTIDNSQRSVFMDFNKTVGETSPTTSSVTAALDQSQNPAIASSFAKLVGEMEAELRVELNRIQRSASETRAELLKEVTMRCATTEARCGTIEADLKVKINSVADDVLPRLAKLDGAQLPSRLQNLEQEVKRNSLLLAEKVATGGRDQSPYRLRHSPEATTSIPQVSEARQAGLLHTTLVERQRSMATVERQTNTTPRLPSRAAAAISGSEAPTSDVIDQLVYSFTKALSEKIVQEREGADGLLAASKGSRHEVALGSRQEASSPAASELGAGSGSNVSGGQLSGDLKSSLQEILTAVTRTLSSSGGGSSGGRPAAKDEPQPSANTAPGSELSAEQRAMLLASKHSQSRPSLEGSAGAATSPLLEQQRLQLGQLQQLQKRPSQPSPSPCAQGPTSHRVGSQPREQAGGKGGAMGSGHASPKFPPQAQTPGSPPPPQPVASQATGSPPPCTQSSLAQQLRGRNGLRGAQAAHGQPTKSPPPGIANQIMGAQRIGIGAHRMTSGTAGLPVASHAGQPVRAGSAQGQIITAGKGGYMPPNRGHSAGGAPPMTTRVRSL